jgi:thiosulfate/3-mercaptopyruvate sulfurtransferase
VVAYDRQHNPMACRLLWTLNEIAHPYFSLLNGGWDAWRDNGLPVDRKINEPEPSRYRAKRTGRALATKDYILNKLNNPEVIILDTRMHEEYTNDLIITDRGGMIPGAIHHDWLDSIDEEHNYRIRKTEEILPVITKLGVTPEKEVITYCQSHLRSAHTYFILKLMGYPRVLGYAAGYSEWGNDPATPIENEQEAV